MPLYRDLIVYPQKRGWYKVTVWSGDENGIHGKLFSRLVKGKKMKDKLKESVYEKYEISR